MSKQIKICVLLFCLYFTGCSKSEFKETDPATGNEPGVVSDNITDTCLVSEIQQISGSVIYNSYNYIKNNQQQTTSITYKENSGASQVKANFQYKADSILIGNNEWMIKNPVTGNIEQYYCIEKLNAQLSDQVLYKYEYNNEGELVRKKIYYNGAVTPDFVSYYLYDNSNLVGVELRTGSSNVLLLTSSIVYDMQKDIKPWIYCYTDFFENNTYLQAFSFGKKITHPLLQIKSTLYDAADGKTLDTWTTNFSGYVISKDKYVLQASANGDNQQGLGFLIGDLRFGYKCK